MTIQAAGSRLNMGRVIRVGVAVGLGVTARVVAERAAAEGRKGLGRLATRRPHRSRGGSEPFPDG